MTFTKGHGTRNDFVIIADRHGMVPVTAAEVRFLCDRRGGIGADGLLRVTMAGQMPDWDGPKDLWFMDYRNADGSIAEMCGNGLRVFARYLMENDLVEVAEHFDVATRAGVRRIWPQLDGTIRTSMGRVGVAQGPVTVSTTQGSWAATQVDVGNPHAVVVLDEQVSLAELDLSRAPEVPAEAYPQGANVEFVEVLDERHIRMRVHERGSGETMSCGTGTVAAAAAHARLTGLGDGEVRVDVPGGTLRVGLAEGEATLCGPAVLVARGEAMLPDNL
ncbi:diaminopimelate epimerase [Luteococcus peritonei]